MIALLGKNIVLLLSVKYCFFVFHSKCYPCRCYSNPSAMSRYWSASSSLPMRRQTSASM